MSEKYYHDEDHFICSDRDMRDIIAMEYLSHFEKVRQFLEKECRNGKLKGKYCGEIRFIVESKFGIKPNNS